MHADILRVRVHRGSRDALHVVRQVRARADAACTILGAIARPLSFGEARVAAQAGERLRGDAAEAFNEPNNDFVALADYRIAIVERVDSRTWPRPVVESNGGSVGRPRCLRPRHMMR